MDNKRLEQERLKYEADDALVSKKEEERMNKLLDIKIEENKGVMKIKQQKRLGVNEEGFKMMTDYVHRKCIIIFGCFSLGTLTGYALSQTFLRKFKNMATFPKNIFRAVLLCTPSFFFTYFTYKKALREFDELTLHLKQKYPYTNINDKI